MRRMHRAYLIPKGDGQAVPLLRLRAMVSVAQRPTLLAHVMRTGKMTMGEVSTDDSDEDRSSVTLRRSLKDDQAVSHGPLEKFAIVLRRTDTLGYNRETADNRVVINKYLLL